MAKALDASADHQVVPNLSVVPLWRDFERGLTRTPPIWRLPHLETRPKETVGSAAG